MSRFSNLAGRLHRIAFTASRPWAHLDLLSWLTLVLPFFVWALAVTMMGPFIQQHTAPLLSSGAPTLYEAVYPTGLAQFPTLTGWLKAIWRIEILPVALATTLGAFAFRSLKGMVIGGGLGFALSFLVVDSLILIFQEEATFGVAELVLANLVGGTVLSLAIMVAVAVIAFVHSNLAATRHQRQLVSVLVFVFFAALTVAGTDLAIRAFFRPLDSRVDILIGQSAAGTFGQSADWVASKHDADPSEVRLKEFSLLPAKATAASLTFGAPEGTGEIQWARQRGKATYTLRLFSYDGCLRNAATDGSKGKPSLTVANVTNLRIAPGADDLAIRSKAPFLIDERGSATNHFWLTSSDNKEQFQLQTFTREGSEVQLSGRDGVTIEVLYNLLDVSNDLSTLRPEPSVIRFSVNGVTYLINAKPPGAVAETAPLGCELRPVVFPPSGEPGIANARVPRVTIVFDLQRTAPTDGVLTRFEHQTKIAGTAGWLTYENVDRSASGLGGFGMLLLNKDLKSLEVELKPISVRSSDRLHVEGDLDASYTSEGDLQVTGMANALWRNSTRLNQTFWERLAEGWQLAIIGAFFTGLLALAQFVRTTLRGRWYEKIAEWHSA